jgi:hypothetical protein
VTDRQTMQPSKEIAPFGREVAVAGPTDTGCCCCCGFVRGSWTGDAVGAAQPDGTAGSTANEELSPKPSCCCCGGGGGGGGHVPGCSTGSGGGQ